MAARDASRGELAAAKGAGAARSAEVVQQAAGLAAAVAQRAEGQLADAVGLRAAAMALALGAQDHEADGRGRADDCGRRGAAEARPVLRVAERGELPGVELVGGQLDQRSERRLEPLLELERRLDGR